MMKRAGWLLALVGLLVGCGTEGPGDSVGTASQALTAEQNRVLGFEAPITDWSTTNGSPRSASTDVVEGSQSLSVTINGYTEIVSAQIPVPGSSRPHATIAVKPLQAVPWGEARLVMVIPSAGHYWRDLGGRSLVGLAAGSFHTLSFEIPADIQTALQGSSIDLTFRVIINGPSGSTFLLDNLIVSDDEGAPTGEPGTEPEVLSVSVPVGQSVPNVVISGTSQVTIDDRSTIGEDGKTTVVSSVGPETTEFGAGIKIYGNVFSEGNLDFLRSQAHVYGSLTTEGTILQQDNVHVDGGVFTGVPISPAVTEWAVDFPAGEGPDVSLPPDSPNYNLAPGHYDSIQVFSRSTITLVSGQYFIDSFVLEPQVNFQVDASGGPVLIYVRDTLLLRSSIEYIGGEEGQVIFGYLGNQVPLFEEAIVAGVVAPNAIIELRRPNSGNPHKGAFFGKGVHVFSDATVLHIPFDFGFLCSLPDTDGDGALDCFDGCRRDPGKTAPGICDCGTPETDTDGDGVPDCADECPLDASDQHRGVCGCPSDPTPAGTSCRDGICRGLHACDGAGSCGDPMECAPDPTCFEVYYPPEEKFYWICEGPSDRDDAAGQCAAVDGRKLAEIGDSNLNSYLAGFLGGDSWIGASTPDGSNWYWDGLDGSPRDQFWMGGPEGREYFSQYANWSGGRPVADESCAAMDVNGSWSPTSCALSQGYVCSVDNANCLFCNVPPSPTCQHLGICSWGGGLGPDPDTCVSEEEAFGGLSEAELIDAMAACSAACASDPDSQACQDACTGPAAPPTNGSTCDPLDELLLPEGESYFEEGENCGEGTSPVTPHVPCIFSWQCDQEQQEICTNQYAGGGVGFPRLCSFQPPCFSTQELPTLCEDIEICEDGLTQTVTTIAADGSDMTPEPFEPSERFAEPSIPEEEEPYPVDETPCSELGQASCVGIGLSHPWCHLGSADALPSQPAQNPDKTGNTDGGMVNFTVDPIFELTHSAQLGAFGIPDLTLTAQAGLIADVNFNIPAIPADNFTLLNALADLDVDECGIETADLTLEVFENDLFSGDLDEAIEGTFSAEARAACQDAVGKFQEAANRTEKALRDTVELLRQYRARTANDDPADPTTFQDNFPADLCRDLGLTQPPRGFPSGFCPADPDEATESAEATINRFIGYYERSATSFGGIDGAVGLIDALDQLTDAMPQGSLPFSFYNDGDSRDIVLLYAQFFIGPIPVVLEVTAFGAYNINIGAQLDFKTGAVLDTLLTTTAKNAAQNVVMAKVTGTPSAGAGLGAFAGVGFGIPGFEAKIGVETTLSLAEVWFPAHAGVGIGLGSTLDTREPASDMIDFASPGVTLIPAKRYSAELLYSAGLGGMVRNILSGDVAGKLKISVLFFSKTWRKRILSFSGICDADLEIDQVPAPNPDCDFDLIKEEGSLNASVGGFGWGEVRMPVNFPKLSSLIPNAAPAGEQPLDPSRVDQLFFDTQCLECIDGDNPPEDRECFRNDDCCANLPVCFPTLSGNECIECRKPGVQRFDATRTDNNIPVQVSSENPSLKYENCRVDSDCCDGGLCTFEHIPTSCTLVEGTGDLAIDFWNCVWESPPEMHCQPAEGPGDVVK